MVFCRSPSSFFLDFASFVVSWIRLKLPANPMLKIFQLLLYDMTTVVQVLSTGFRVIFLRPEMLPYTLNRAPFTSACNCTCQILHSLSRNISPRSPKQKLAIPPGIRILPRRMPPSFHTLTPSPHPEYTLPATSHLIPSGNPTAAMANSLRFARNGDPPR